MIIIIVQKNVVFVILSVSIDTGLNPNQWRTQEFLKGGVESPAFLQVKLFVPYTQYSKTREIKLFEFLLFSEDAKQ
jgi:hypothetical protein